MNKKNLVVGTRVAIKLGTNDIGEEIRIHSGSIIDKPVSDFLTGDLKVRVKWDIDPTPCDVFVRDIDLEDNIKKHAIKLEEEFIIYQNQVIDKMKEAGKLIFEANKLAKNAGMAGLPDMHNALGPLYDAMDFAGWDISSLSC